jgi:hypothetical protein
MLDRLQDRVFSDAWGSAKHECMVDFILRPLDAMRKPCEDMAGLGRVNGVGKLDPSCGGSGVAADYRRRAV